MCLETTFSPLLLFAWWWDLHKCVYLFVMGLYWRGGWGDIVELVEVIIYH